MNEPIINPWIFYFMELADTVKVYSGALSIILMAVMGLVAIYNNDKGLTFAKYKKGFIKMAILSMFFALLSLFVPSSNTIARMTIASQITPANIETAKETGRDFVDYIVEKVKETHNE